MEKVEPVQAWGFIKPDGTLHERTVASKELAEGMTRPESIVFESHLEGLKVVRVEIKVIEA